MAPRILDAAVAPTSICCFSLGAVTSALALTRFPIFFDHGLTESLAICAAAALPVAVSVKLLLWLGRKCINEDQESVIPRALFLGVSFGAGLSTVLSSPSSSVAVTVGLYSSALSFFHYSEFLSTAWWNPKHLSVDSFLLNHSPEYHVALAASWLEFLLEYFLFDYFGIIAGRGKGGVLSKDFDAVAKAGLALIVVGEFCRKLAMWTAKANFNHLIQWEKNPEHVLVTSGIYSLSRHPSYVGWFLWSVGTQVLLKNPFCFLAYSAVSWRFFSERIYEEEHTLLNFFGDDYINYQEKVGTGLPGVKGFLLDDDQKAFIKRKWAQRKEADESTPRSNHSQ